MRDETDAAGRVKRRHLIQAIGAAGAAGLAGCGCGGDGGDGGGGDGGDGDGGDGGGGELGERVPSVVVEYWSDIGNTSRIMEQSINQMADDYQDIGVQLDIRPTERRGVLAAFLTMAAAMAAHQLLETARDALFLASLPASRLPWVYLAIAVPPRP